MTESSGHRSSQQGHPQPERLTDEGCRYTGSGIPHRVFVKARQGENATIAVMVVQGQVWLSISPPFTWEAIIEPVKVDELLHVLELARDEAKNMPVARDGSPSRMRQATVRAITGSSKADSH
jgi:hypothetical protein